MSVAPAQLQGTRRSGDQQLTQDFTDGPTSWHTVFSFNEYQHSALERIGKGSTVYVEADLEMRKSEPIDGNPVPDRVFLRQSASPSPSLSRSTQLTSDTLRPINKVRPETESEPEAEAE